MKLALACIVSFMLGWSTHMWVQAYILPTLIEQPSAQPEPRYPLLEEGAVNDLRTEPCEEK